MLVLQGAEPVVLDDVLREFSLKVAVTVFAGVGVVNVKVPEISEMIIQFKSTSAHEFKSIAQKKL